MTSQGAGGAVAEEVEDVLLPSRELTEYLRIMGDVLSGRGRGLWTETEEVLLFRPGPEAGVAAVRLWAPLAAEADL